MKKFILLTMTLLCFKVVAQNSPNNREKVVKKILNQTDDISYEVTGSLSPTKDLREALRHLRIAKRLVTGGQQSNFKGLSCVSRDNDNRYPFLFAFPSDNFSFQKIRGERFNTLQECKKVKSEGMRIGRKSLFCLTKKNDGRYPYRISSVNRSEGIKRMGGDIDFGTYDSCLFATQNARVVGMKMAFCVSYYNHKSYPMVVGILNLESMKANRKLDRTFNDRKACLKYLRNF